MKKQVVIEVICFLFILLFIYAAASKLMDYEKFKMQIGQSPVLTPFASWVAWIIPSVEILISLMLAIPRWRLLGLYAALTLMIVFTLYIIAILTFSDYIPCSCGGILEKLGWTEHLIFNAVFIVVGLAGIILSTRPSEDNGMNKKNTTDPVATAL